MLTAAAAPAADIVVGAVVVHVHASYSFPFLFHPKKSQQFMPTFKFCLPNVSNGLY